MAALEFQIVINAPQETLFAYLSDLQNHVDWSSGSAIRKTSEGTIAVGSTYETEEKGPLGRTIREKSQVTQYQPNDRFGWRSYGPMGTWLDWSFELRPQDGNTVLIERFEPRRSLLTTVLSRLFIERAMRKTLPDGLAKIKARVEGG